jgi:hypothetical protein
VAEAGADHKPAGRALKCRACNGKLLLNALALQQHVASKQHLRKVKGAQAPELLDWHFLLYLYPSCSRSRGGRRTVGGHSDTGVFPRRLRRGADRPHLLR